jgi:hypothetical protein
MEENRMKKHVSAVAAIRITLHTIGLLGIIVAFGVVNFAFSFIPVEDLPEAVMPLITGIIYFVFIVIATVSILGLIAAIGLLGYKSWARILTIVVSAISCFNIPIGTLAGVYSIWVMLQDDTIKLFQDQK